MQNIIQHHFNIPNVIECGITEGNYAMKKNMNVEEIRNILFYNKETGEFRWRVSRGGMKAGSVAGHVAIANNGRKVIQIGTWLAHRLAWFITYGVLPPGDLDHKDGDSLNNRIKNLRPASMSQNLQNAKRRIDNKSGYKGVSFDAFTGKWVARIRIPNGKYKNLGRFSNPKIAHAAYVAEAKNIFGEFARAA